MTRTLFQSTIAIACTAGAMATAQTTIDWATIDGGGGRSSAGNVVLDGTIGQADAGDSRGGQLLLRGGFWDLNDPVSTIRMLRAAPGIDRVQLSWRGATGGLNAYVLDRVSPGGAVHLGSVPIDPSGHYSFVDTAATSGITHLYVLSEFYAPSVTIPRASIEAKSIAGAGLPANIARVGAGGFGSIDAAIQSAAPGTTHLTVFVESGTYPAFTVPASAPGTLRILGDDTGSVQVDTSGGPIQVTGRNPLQTTELHGMTIGSTGTAGVGLLVQNSTGVVILDEIEVAANGFAAVEIVQSSAVALQSCALTGAPGLSMSAANAVAGRTSTTGLVSDLGSTLTSAELDNTGSQQLLAGSSHSVLPGVMPDVDSPQFMQAGCVFTIDVEAEPMSNFGLFLAFENFFFQVPGFEMALLMNPAPLLLQLGGGVTDPTGAWSTSLAFAQFPPELVGRGLPIQAIAIDPGTFGIRFSNAATNVVLQ